MPADSPTILATSGGMTSGTRTRLELAGLVHHAVELAGVTGRSPRICHVGTAAGDQRWYNAEVSEAGRVAGYVMNHLTLFPMPNVDDIESYLGEHDVVWVNGGSVANLLAVWRVHGLDGVFPRLWQAGVVLGGVSAGSICWYSGGTTDSFGPQLRAVTDGLGLLPYGNGVHYDSEARRRPLVHELVSHGVFDEVHCTDDGVGIRYRGTEWVEAVAEQPGKGAYVVTRSADGSAVETRVEPRRL